MITNLDIFNGLNGSIKHKYRRAFTEAFSHARPRRQNDKVRLLKTTGEAVQVSKAGGYPREAFFYVFQLLNLLQELTGQATHSIDTSTHIALRNFEERILRIVEQVKYVGRIFEGVVDRLGRDTDQLTLNEFLRYDPRVILNIGR